LTKKQGVFCCYEVTIGWYGKERVDYLTYDTKGIWRFYEIKVSKSDFNSKAHNTFLGHFNYYVMPMELYDEVKDEIPSDIGVYVTWGCKKKAKKRELGVDEQILKDSMIRSLYREAEKLIKSSDPSIVERLQKQLNKQKKETDLYVEKYRNLNRSVIEKFGTRWNKE
jgi:hypothetical protein